MKIINLFFCHLFILLSTNLVKAQSTVFETLATFGKHTNEVTSLCFSPDNHYLFTGSKNGEVFIWNLENMQFLQQLSGHNAKITSISFSNNGSQFATASYDGTIKLWNSVNKSLTKTFQNSKIDAYENVNGDEPTFVSFGADDRFLYFGGYNLQVLQIDLQNQTTKTIYTDAENGITCGLLSSDKKNIAFASKNKIQYFNPITQSIEKEYTINFTNSIKDWVCELAFSPDKKYLAAWTYGGEIVFLKADALSFSHKIKASLQDGSSGLVFSPNSKTLISGSVGNQAIIWSVANQTQVQTLIGHNAACQTFAFSSNGKYIATGSNDKTVKIWHIKPTTIENQPTITTNPNNTTNPNTNPNTINTETTPLENTPITVGQSIVLKKLQFEQSKAVLLPSSYKELDNLATLMQKHPSLEIRLDGHTDNVGSSNKNYELSDKRVKSVKAYLMNIKNIAEHRIKTEAFGDSQPIADNINEETRKLNRRVEFKVLKL